MVKLDEALSVYYIVFNSYLLIYHVYACFFHLYFIYYVKDGWARSNHNSELLIIIYIVYLLLFTFGFLFLNLRSEGEKRASTWRICRIGAVHVSSYNWSSYKPYILV